MSCKRSRVRIILLTRSIQPNMSQMPVITQWSEEHLLKKFCLLWMIVAVLNVVVQSFLSCDSQSGPMPLKRDRASVTSCFPRGTNYLLLSNPTVSGIGIVVEKNHQVIQPQLIIRDQFLLGNFTRDSQFHFSRRVISISRHFSFITPLLH